MRIPFPGRFGLHLPFGERILFFESPVVLFQTRALPFFPVNLVCCVQREITNNGGLTQLNIPSYTIWNGVPWFNDAVLRAWLGEAGRALPTPHVYESEW